MKRVPSSSIETLEARIAPAFAAAFELSSLDGLNGFTINGIAGELSGISVGDAGDVNGDGFGDLIIASRSRSYVIFGKASGFAAGLELSALDGSDGFKLSGAFNGRYASAAGDVNGDGFDDLIIGSPRTPATYVIFGKESGFAADLNVSTLNGSNGFKLTPVSFGLSGD
jgi:hypothetical protein